MRKPGVLTVLMFLMLLAVSIVFVSSFDITITSSAQNTNSSTTTNKNQNQNDTRSIAPPSGAGGQQQDFSQNTWELPADADKTKNPTPATPESIAKGKSSTWSAPKVTASSVTAKLAQVTKQLVRGCAANQRIFRTKNA